MSRPHSWPTPVTKLFLIFTCSINLRVTFKTIHIKASRNHKNFRCTMKHILDDCAHGALFMIDIIWVVISRNISSSFKMINEKLWTWEWSPYITKGQEPIYKHDSKNSNGVADTCCDTYSLFIGLSQDSVLRPAGYQAKWKTDSAAIIHLVGKHSGGQHSVS